MWRSGEELQRSGQIKEDTGMGEEKIVIRRIRILERFSYIAYILVYFCVEKSTKMKSFRGEILLKISMVLSFVVT